jgi:cation-transporting ATPase E
MFIALTVVFTVPLATEFFALVDPGEELAVAMTGIVIVMIAAIEVVRLFHRRFVARAISGGVGAGGVMGGATESRSRAASIVVMLIAILAYGGALLATGLGIVVLLSRYELTDPSEVRFASLTGASLVLLGLLVLSAAAGLRRGSGLSRLMLTVWFSLLFALDVLVVIASDRWDGGSAFAAGVAAVVIVLLWVPPASRSFGRVRDSSMMRASGSG